MTISTVCPGMESGMKTGSVPMCVRPEPPKVSFSTVTWCACPGATAWGGIDILLIL